MQKLQGDRTEPISVSFEVGEPAPERETMQQAQGAVLQPLTRTLTSSQSTFRFGRFHFSRKLSGEMFCRDTCHPEKAIFSFNSTAFPRKAKTHPQPPTAGSNTPGQSKSKPLDRSCATLERSFCWWGGWKLDFYIAGVQTAPWLCLAAL